VLLLLLSQQLSPTRPTNKNTISRPSREPRSRFGGGGFAQRRERNVSIDDRWTYYIIINVLMLYTLDFTLDLRPADVFLFFFFSILD
jgi:hypothetical protein